MVEYKWTVLSNTTIGVLMATIDGTIVLISLPAIFRGIGLNPIAPDSFEYLLWILFGYTIITATLLVTFGRISDMFGRVRFYNLGFAIFTVGSVLAYLTPNTGTLGALELIIFRLVQGVGGAFLWANSAAIVTDAFPPNERGQALGINMVTALAGSLIGLIMGGVLAAYNWRYIFLVVVPVGVFGTIWSYWKLKEIVTVRGSHKLDIWGNLVFALGLTLVMVGVTYGLVPYGGSDMGWGNPWVLASLIGGSGLLVAFPFVESRVKNPMFKLSLFRNRAFAMGNLAGLLASISRGGVQLMLVILLQGIWLPLHGYSYESTPFWSGIYITPMLLGFVIVGPISGRISDRRGARELASAGMLVSAAGFIALSLLPYDFSFPEFAVILLAIGIGGGMFASPNIAAIMNAAPAEDRGAASGMRAIVQNAGQTASLAFFFSIVLIALAIGLPSALASAVTNAGAPQLAPAFEGIPPTSALFAAFLGYNPVGSILANMPPQVVASIPQSTQTYLTSNTFFPTAIAPAFMSALQVAFYVGAALSIIAAVVSLRRGAFVPVYSEEAETGSLAGSDAPTADP